MSHIKLKPFNKDLDETMNQIVDIAKKSFNKSLLLVGGKGSIARNEFTPYSDFDILIVVKDKKYERWPEFMYNDTYFDIEVATLDEVMKRLQHIGINWPVRAGGILNLKVYYDADIYHKIIKKYAHMKKNPKMFEKGVSLNTIIEYYSKALRYYDAKDYDSLRWATMWLFEDFSLILALMNMEYYKEQGPSSKIRQILRFKYKPKGWLEISRKLLSTSPKDNIDGANKLYTLCHKLSKKHKFAEHDIKDIKEIKFNH